jgi:hypothetical protein
MTSELGNPKSNSVPADPMRCNSASLTDASSFLRRACGAAKRER